MKELLNSAEVIGGLIFSMFSFALWIARGEYKMKQADDRSKHNLTRIEKLEREHNATDVRLGKIETEIKNLDHNIEKGFEQQTEDSKKLDGKMDRIIDRLNAGL